MGLSRLLYALWFRSSTSANPIVVLVCFLIIPDDGEDNAMFTVYASVCLSACLPVKRTGLIKNVADGFRHSKVYRCN